MTTSEKKDIPVQAGAGQAQDPDPILSAASLENVNGGVSGLKDDVPVMDGYNVLLDSPDAGDPFGRLRP